jgi:hypothetical protein
MTKARPEPKHVKTSFLLQVVRLKTKILVSSKQLDKKDRSHHKYLQIAASLTAVGLIEPLVVFPAAHGTYLVLDGHKRLDILTSRKAQEVECLISTDDEAYTYNRHANYLSSVGEHQMILRALQHNSEETIAAALNVNISTIRKKRDLLDGICKEAVDVLKDRRVPSYAFAIMRKMKPVRQAEAAELMVSSNLYSHRFVGALLAGTRDEMLVPQNRVTTSRTIAADQTARIASETENLLQNSKVVEETYGTEALILSVCCRYVKKLLDIPKVARYVSASHPDLSVELHNLTTLFTAESVGNGDGSASNILRRERQQSPAHRPVDRADGPRSVKLSSGLT